MELKTIKLVLLFGAISMMSSCYYDAENELYPSVNCDTETMSYKDDVSPIITQNCFACHRNNSTISTISLEGYNNLLVQVESGTLVGTITHASGYSPMPQNLSRMSDCNISKIQAWILQGALDN